MIIPVRLFPVDKRSKDGSLITTKAVEDYIMSDSYKKMLDKKVSFSCITHVFRNKKDFAKMNGVGPNDQILLNKTNVGFIIKVYIKSDGWAYADIETFDPNLFEGDMRENILYITGMIKSGCVLPGSVAIDAMWTSSEEARIINEIKGYDWTLDPSFKDSEVVKSAA